MLRRSSTLALADRPGAERRRDKRYQVDLPGTAQVGEVACPVLVSDISASGALVAFAAEPGAFRAGSELTLVLDEFGAIEARIAHVGSNFYGLSFVNPHLFRDRLAHWLRQEVTAT